MSGYFMIYVLDMVKGCLVEGIKIVFYSVLGNFYCKIVEIVMNEDGCIDVLILLIEKFKIGIYELIFFCGDYLCVM